MSFKKKNLYLSLVVTALAVPVASQAVDFGALTGGGSSTPTNTQTGASSTNTATTQGLKDQKNNSLGALAPESSGIGLGDAAYGGGATVNDGDIQEAVKNCEIVEAHEEAQRSAIEMASITPNIDEIFNSVSESAKGCFASSEQIINLAAEIPNINSGWDAVRSQLQKRMEKILQDKANEIMNQGCNIAQDAIRQAVNPIAGYIDKFEAQANSASNSIFGNMQVGNRTTTSVSDILRGMDLGFNKPANPAQRQSATVGTVSNPSNVANMSVPSFNPSIGMQDTINIPQGASTLAPAPAPAPQARQPVQQQGSPAAAPAPAPVPAPAPAPAPPSSGTNPY